MSVRRAATLLALALALGGCAGVRLPAPPWSATEPPPTRAAAERARAERLERDGALREALAAWATALAHEPGDIPTRRAVRRVRARIDREVADLLRRGRLAAAEARRHYAAALALDPQSRPALDALRSVSTAESPRSPLRADPKPGLSTPVRLETPKDESKRERLAHEQYQLGLQLFREEKIEDAIAVWRAVLELDPGHANARRSIEQAERILRTLAEEQRPLTATPP